MFVCFVFHAFLGFHLIRLSVIPLILKDRLELTRKKFSFYLEIELMKKFTFFFIQRTIKKEEKKDQLCEENLASI
jgi:hypothetical protein